MCNLALAVWLTWLATAQPWLGLDLDARGNQIRIAQVDPAGPVPAALQGAQLIRLGASGTAVEVTPVDLIEEPDTLGTAERLVAFYARQQQLFAVLSGETVTLTVAQGGVTEQVAVTPAPKRPLSDLPVKFWVQIFVAFTGMIIGAWVVCLRRDDAAAWMFLVVGVGLAMASGAASLYSVREVALSLPVFGVASRVNSVGALLFGVGMITLFLIYPRRIVPKPLVVLPAIVIALWSAYMNLVAWPQHAGMLQTATAAEMAVILLTIVAQVIVNRRDARARAMLGWLGLSVALGAGGFVLTVVVPNLLGRELLVAQSTAFLFFLLIYVGLALAVLRYRLFDLATWSLSILFYGIGVALLLLLDAALIYGLSLDRAPAFGVALAAVGLVYLPLRERAARWLGRGRSIPVEDLYRRVTEIAHSIDPVTQEELHRAMWSDLFNPLAIVPLEGPVAQTTLADNGAALILGHVLGLPALRLEWAGLGARLFSSADLARAKAINAVIDQSLRQHQTYLEAVTSERRRINRDMHDNIGVLLLSALHTGAAERKDLLIRQTLTDLREIISNPDQQDWQLGQLVADLRAEIVDHLEAADIAVRWHDEGLPNVTLRPLVVHTLRSFLREGTSNIVRHSGARSVTITLSAAPQGQGMRLSMADTGHGFDDSTVRPGNGFRNLAARVRQAGGTFDLTSTPAGTTMSASLPFGQSQARAAE
ncbi:sensor histidine kinase [Phaeovulum sp. W22_SRMD_FR3]|uniref:sensor histidine kinase n=1 Tax=Phaeovulum sp. W22_SRMD_FR3 TaxID=3240274 RepID=UPI003F9AAC2D